jgi:hypothetical protein
LDTPAVTLQSPRIAVFRMRAAARWHVLATVMIPASLGLPLLVAFEAPSWFVPMFVVCASVALVSAVVAQLLRSPAWRSGALEVGAAGVRVQFGRRTLEIPRTSLERAVVLQGVEGAQLELHLRGGDLVRLAIASADEGKRFVREAGLPKYPSVEEIRFVTTAHQAVVFALRWMMGIFLVSLTAGALFGLFGGDVSEQVGGLVFAAAVVVMTTLVGWTTLPRWLQVGADGVVVRTGPFRRFVPYAAVTDVQAGAAGLVLGTSLGEIFSFFAAPPYEDAPQRGLLAIGARMETWRLQSMCERGSLERGGRDIATWRDAVAAEVGGAGVFRDAAFGREALVELVESPVALPTQRLGAALALADAGDDMRTRVRVAADACANASLQQALGAVLEQRLDEAMAQRVERAEADEV